MSNPTEREHFTEGQNQYQESDRVLKTDDPGAGPQGIVPNLQSRIVVGVFERREQAQAALADLVQAGFPRDDISLVLQQPGSPAEVGAGQTEADQGMAVGVSAGAVLGGLAGLAALAIPGIGPLLAAGPIAAALGAMGGAALGGLVGSFTGLGIPTEQAKQFEEAVRAGGVVVAAKVADREEEQRASRILEQHQPRDIGSYTQAL